MPQKMGPGCNRKQIMTCSFTLAADCIIPLVVTMGYSTAPCVITEDNMPHAMSHDWSIYFTHTCWICLRKHKCIATCSITYLSKLPWIFPGAPLEINGAPGNIQGNLTGMLSWTDTETSQIHWDGNMVILMKFSSLAAPQVVILTTFSAAYDENFIKMMTSLI